MLCPPSPALDHLRGFVLGKDDRIDAATVEEFKRSGLAHLLSCSQVTRANDAPRPEVTLYMGSEMARFGTPNPQV